MSEPTFSFNGQLGVGDMGESFMAEIHADEVTRTNGRKNDFIVTGSTDHLEVKTETYNCETQPKYSPNFFIERHSRESLMNPGGPWQSKGNGTKYYCHIFIQNRVAYYFKTDTLVAEMEKLVPVHNYRMHRVFNKNGGNSYYTLGYIVPREHLKHICIKVNYKVEKPKLSEVLARLP